MRARVEDRAGNKGQDKAVRVVLGLVETTRTEPTMKTTKMREIGNSCRIFLVENLDARQGS